MPKRKSDAAELDLDALFVELDSEVMGTTKTKLTLASNTPKRTRTGTTPRNQALSPTFKGKEKVKSSDIDAFLGIAKASSMSPSKPLHPSSSSPKITSNSSLPTTPRRQRQVDLDALVDGLTWEDMEWEITPAKPSLTDENANETLHKGIGATTQTPTSARRMQSQTPSKSLVRKTPSSGRFSAKKLLLKQKTPLSIKALDLEALFDGAEAWSDDFGSDEDELQAGPLNSRSPLFKPPKVPEPPEIHRDPCTRCVVLKVSSLIVKGREEKYLEVKDDVGYVYRTVILKDDWVLTKVEPGDIINVIGIFSDGSPFSTPTITVSSTLNVLILHPDMLLSATAISNASKCIRKPLLSSLLHASADTSPALVWGNMLHEVMQSCLGKGDWSSDFIEAEIERVVREGLEDLVKIDVGIEAARVELRMRALGLKNFSERFIGPEPKPHATLTDLRSTSKSQSLLALTALHDIEETIWSPTYGLKGILDASVQARIVEISGFETEEQQWTLPFEIKTGRSVAGMEHRAQTMLYTLLMEERYRVSVPAGLLYYTQSEEVIRVPANRNELRGLIIGRNEIAAYMMRRGWVDRAHLSAHMQLEQKKEGPKPFLPSTIDDEWTCSKCFQMNSCMLYRKAVEEVEDTTSPIADMYERKTSHLTPAHAAFFKKWEALIALEEQDMDRFRKELWTMTGAAREKLGRCFAGMMIQSYTFDETRAHARHIYEFVRGEEIELDESFLSGHLTQGDAVLLSVEPDLLAISRGYIFELNSTRVVVGVDREVHDALLGRGRLPTTTATARFRIDKDELTRGMGRIRDNLAQLFYVQGDVQRLGLIVDLVPPVFDATLTPAEEDIPYNLNASQKEAVQKVMSARDYALILGMPGTGKTTVIAEIIKMHVEAGKTVLLTSYTHSAVDTILRKLVDTDLSILRLGVPAKIHTDVRKYTLEALPPATSIQQLEQRLLTPRVVATTCLSIDHALFSRRKFDVCIVDEASQITLPTCIGPLRFAEKFVLVGDHHQLPPLVRSRGARKGGLEMSLFRLLCDTHPQAVVDLTFQYRMNEDIMLLANTLVYKMKLQCGSEEVREQKLILSNEDNIKKLHEGADCSEARCWMREVMDPSRRAVFLDTDDMSATESHVGDLIQNETESNLIHQIVETMLMAGIEESQLGIITFYRQQHKLLSNTLGPRNKVEILTADRSQGRDKDCVIISMVRSNEEGNTGDLLKDWRRINVALTRARCKLIVIGSQKTLRTEPLLARMLELMNGQRWVLRLPPQAERLHPVKSSSALTGAQDKEDDKGKKGKVGEGILKGHGMLKDVMNDLA